MLKSLKKSKLKIIIVGGGFAGLKLANELRNLNGAEILLIDKYNYHQFQPLFYQVATGGLDASNISFPLRKAFHGYKNVKYRLAILQQIHERERYIDTDIGKFSFDLLVVATGADTNWYGNQNIQAKAFPMKSTVEALQLRHRLIENFERALGCSGAAERKSLMTIVVVGAGPTGVEISGAFSELRAKILPKDYPELDFTEMRVVLLEGANKTLSVMSAKSSSDSLQYLNELNIEVRLNTFVKDYDGENVTLSSGEIIQSSTVIWAAGVTGNVPNGIGKECLAPGNRIKVDRYNQVLGSECLFALGDICFMETPLYPKGHPQLANVANTQAKNLAKNIMRKLAGSSEWVPYEYYDKGSMATIGRHRAVVDIPKPKLHVNGYLAWLMWMGLHLLLILGAKNKIQIFINWIYKYFTWDQSLRLLIKHSYRERKEDNK